MPIGQKQSRTNYGSIKKEEEMVEIISSDIRKPELVAPAGDPEKLKIALHYGADAVYVGAAGLNLRAYTKGFDYEQLKEAVKEVHDKNKKIYIALNVFAHNRQLEYARSYINDLALLNVDGFIISDPGIFSIARETAPDIPVHLSTQAGVTNSLSAEFWLKQGATRIIPARELTLDELTEIRRNVNIEIEVFVHGAMCIAYSGRCLISAYYNGKSANRGECKQPCRWGYRISENERPSDPMILNEEEEDSYILSSRDLNMISHIPDLITAGIDAFKIEGRMKGIHYLATVVRAYRKAIDSYIANPQDFSPDPHWEDELKKVSHRPYHTGFFFGTPQQVDPNEKTSYFADTLLVGVVLDYDHEKKMLIVEQRNNFKKSDILEVLSPDNEPFTFRVEKIINKSGEEVESAPHAQEIVSIPLNKELKADDILRLQLNKRKKES